VVKGVEMTRAAGFAEDERLGVYRAIHERRDVRRGFLPEPLPDEVLYRLLAAAHSAPSVGLMQPWRFIVIRDLAVRQEVHSIFLDANREATASYEGERQEHYKALKLEGILEAPQNLCIVCDSQSSQGHLLGRHTMPETAIYSAVCAVQNLWLAARAEGIGVGWVSILEPSRLRCALKIPAEITPVAYLCLGYVQAFATEPELEQAGWEKRVALQSVLSFDRYDNRSDERGTAK
jgi:5,6-dimethylbenzimidazole synthase